VTVHSDGLGAGSTFVVELPLDDDMCQDDGHAA
jgi:hypothetical protein